ncbi:hypothetical protein PR048_017986 [Dryococelus australis]|uniref:Reverse transcriptase/retrotransposon-derived protein RNase H-like domain-containing protein n=1 Tax=Dryococelus australis TaxID=614101 RepID=A0ABQ9HB54_9NEOP|nr:hypothetical protein PR048_017986 [Dryococelus australis]
MNNVMKYTAEEVAKIALEKFEAGEEDWNSYGERLEHLITNDIGKVDKPFSELISILQMYFSPAPLVIAVRHKFHQCLESSTGSIAQFVAGLRKCIRHCNFETFLDQTLRDQFVVGLRNKDIMQVLYLESEMMLFHKTVKIALSYEKAAENMATVSRDCEHNIPDPNAEVNKILSPGVRHIPRYFESAVPSDQTATNSATYSTNKSLKRKDVFLQVIVAPLHALLKESCKWNWLVQCDDAFATVNRMLTSSKLLAYYDPNMPVRSACDASPHDLGTVTSHVYPSGDERPIAFASYTHTKAPKNYSQIDHEALAILFGVERFSQYLHGRHFTLITDHKPLPYIFGEHKGIPQMAANGYSTEHYSSSTTTEARKTIETNRPICSITAASLKLSKSNSGKSTLPQRAGVPVPHIARYIAQQTDHAANSDICYSRFTTIMSLTNNGTLVGKGVPNLHPAPAIDFTVPTSCEAWKRRFERIVVGMSGVKTSEQLQLLPELILEQAILAAKQAELQSSQSAVLRQEHRRHLAVHRDQEDMPCLQEAVRNLSFLLEVKPVQQRISRVLEGIPGVVFHVDDIVIFSPTISEDDNILRKILHKLEDEGITLNESKSVFGVTQYVPGKELVVADSLPRNPVSAEAREQEEELTQEVEAFVQPVISTYPVTDQFLSVIQLEQEKDPVWHQGITKCCERAKLSVWWMVLSSQLANLIRNSPQCVEEWVNPRKPYQQEPYPSRDWQKSNGGMEAAVKVTKQLLKKNDDISSAILAYRTTPLENGFSSVELLMNRRLRSTIPLLPSKLSQHVEHKCVQQKENSKISLQADSDLREHGTTEQIGPEPRSYMVDTRRDVNKRETPAEVNRDESHGEEDFKGFEMDKAIECTEIGTAGRLHQGRVLHRQ